MTLILSTNRNDLRYLINLKDPCNLNMKKQINKESEEFAKQWIKQGKPCTYRFGWIWDGGKSHKLSKKEAMKMLPKYSFGISIYCLSFINIDGAETLEFNELPENALLV